MYSVLNGCYSVCYASDVRLGMSKSKYLGISEYGFSLLKIRLLEYGLLTLPLCLLKCAFKSLYSEIKKDSNFLISLVLNRL